MLKAEVFNNKFCFKNIISGWNIFITLLFWILQNWTQSTFFSIFKLQNIIKQVIRTSSFCLLFSQSTQKLNVSLQQRYKLDHCCNSASNSWILLFWDITTVFLALYNTMNRNVKVWWDFSCVWLLLMFRKYCANFNSR